MWVGYIRYNMKTNRTRRNSTPSYAVPSEPAHATVQTVKPVKTAKTVKSVKTKPAHATGKSVKTVKSKPAHATVQTGKTVKTGKTGKTVKSVKSKKSTPMVFSTEGEDELYAHLALLIDIMGGTLYETFLELYINDACGTNVRTQQISLPARPTKPPPEYFVAGQPTVFYGAAKGTHFTCTVDGIHLWDAYKEQIQKPSTDHFCQTFTLMRIVNGVCPNSEFGKPFEKLERGEFMPNAYLAKNYACNVIRTVYHNFDQTYVNRFVNEAIVGGNHLVSAHFSLLAFIKKCESYTETDLMNSPDFKQSVFRE